MNNLLSDLVGNDKSALEKSARVKRANNDFGFFCQYYLSDYFYTDSADYQKILYDIADTQALTKTTAQKIRPFVKEKYRHLLVPTSKIAGAMFIEPREHGKTVRWSFAYPLWRALTGKSRYTLLIGASRDAANDNLSNIRLEIEENEKILSDYGDLRGDVWKNNRIELSNGRCIQSKGAGMSMRGTRFRQWRPDLIILDDILKDEEADSYVVRNKIYRWLKRVVFNLGKGSMIIWVNTIFHNDDPISRLCKEVEEKTLKRWIAVRLSCFLQNGEPLWPEYWRKEDLEEKREQLGFSIFATEYKNEALSEEDLIIKPEWIEAWKYIPAELPAADELTNYLGTDPATGAHDHTAMCPISVHKKTGIIYVRPCFAKACSESETTEQMILLHTLYHFAQIGWEDVVFSGIYGNYVQKTGVERHIYLPIKLLKVGGMSKEARVRSVSTLIQNGFIRFAEKGNEDIIKELTEFPKGAFDDLCDALVHAVNVISKGDKPTVVSKIPTKIRTTAKSIIARTRGC